MEGFSYLLRLVVKHGILMYFVMLMIYAFLIHVSIWFLCLMLVVAWSPMAWIVVLEVLRNMIEPRIEIEYLLDGIEMFVNAWEWNGWILVLTNCKYTMLNSLHTNCLIKYQKEFLVLFLCTLMSYWVIKGGIVMCCTSPLGENDIYHLLRCDRCICRWFCSQQVFGAVAGDLCSNTRQFGHLWLF